MENEKEISSCEMTSEQLQEMFNNKKLTNESLKEEVLYLRGQSTFFKNWIKELVLDKTKFMNNDKYLYE